MKPPVYVITLEAVPGPYPPGDVRVKRYLKLAWRGFKLRCIAAKEVQPPDPVIDKSRQGANEA